MVTMKEAESLPLVGDLRLRCSLAREGAPALTATRGACIVERERSLMMSTRRVRAQRSKDLKNDDEWIRRHFEKLVDRYPGQYAVVAEGELFVGHDAGRLFDEARRKHPQVVPTGMPIPRPQDFLCAL